MIRFLFLLLLPALVESAPFVFEGHKLESINGKLHVEQGVAMTFDKNQLTARKASFLNMDKGEDLEFHSQVFLFSPLGIEIQAPKAASKKIERGISFSNSPLSPVVSCTVAPLFLDVQGGRLSFDYRQAVGLKKIRFDQGVTASKPGEFVIQAPEAELTPNELLIWKEASNLNLGYLEFKVTPPDLIFTPRIRQTCKMFVFGNHRFEADRILLNLANKFSQFIKLKGRLIHMGSPLIFEGNKGSWNNLNKTLALDGDVILQSKGGMLSGDRLKAKLTQKEQIDFVRIHGNVAFDDFEKSQFARGDRMVFNPVEDSALLERNDPEKNVVYLDEENRLAILAPKIEVKNLSSKYKREVRGIGNVRFATTEADLRKIKQKIR